MSGQAVFERMVDYHSLTGEVLQGGKFVKEIVRKFELDQIIDGLICFNQYLDEHRTLLENEFLEDIK